MKKLLTIFSILLFLGAEDALTPESSEMTPPTEQPQPSQERIHLNQNFNPIQDQNQPLISPLQQPMLDPAITPPQTPPIPIKPKEKPKNPNLLAQDVFDYGNKEGQNKEKLTLFSMQMLQQKTKQCEENENQLACFDLGMIYYQGRSTEGQNLKKAFYFLDFSCDGNQRLGCYEAGIIKANIGKDYSKAALFLNRACQAKDLRGCRNLGVLFYHGLGVPKQPQIAMKLFNQNCKNGDQSSCQKYYYGLAQAYQSSQNLQGAKKYYKKACELEDKNSCNKIREILILENQMYQQNVIQNNALNTPIPSLQSPKQVPMQHR